MKETVRICCILIGTLGFIISCCIYSKNQTPPIKEYIYVPVNDTVTKKSNIAKIVALQHELTLTRDTLNKVREKVSNNIVNISMLTGMENELAITKDSLKSLQDSLGNELIVARYKLNRIAEYCKIAQKGNNSKYLRGWILRALKD